MKAKFLEILFIVGFITSDVSGQAPPPAIGPQSDNAVFQQGGDGPWNHRILLATSKDGLQWNIEESILAEHGSVPELFLGPDKLPTLLFVDASGTAGPGRLGAMTQRPDGVWQRRETNLRGADPNVVQLHNGTYRGYTKGRDGEIVVYESQNGLDWKWLDEAFRDDRYRQSTDSDVFETMDGWIALISIGPKLLRCTSPDGLRFTADEMMDLGGSVSDTIQADGGWRTYFHVNGNSNHTGRMLIRSAFTRDGKTWSLERGDRLVASPEGLSRFGVGDPAAVRLPDGSWLMAMKSFIEPPRFGPRSQPLGNLRGPPVFNNFNPQPPPQNFNSDGPWNRDVVAYRVNSIGDVERVATFERAGVPTIARMKEGRLVVAHQHFPENDQVNFDKVAVRFSSDEGNTWTAPQVIRVDGLPEGMRFPFDPTLVPLPDGRIRLYFTGNMGRTFGPSVPAIHSAISSDGVNYIYEPGMRFGVDGRMVIDCAVALHAGVFHLYAPDNGTQPRPGQPIGTEAALDRPRQGIGYHATSEDGLNFTRDDDVQMAGRRSWLGNAQSDGEKIIFYGTGEGFSQSNFERPRGEMWIAISNDGQNWNLVPGPVLNSADSGAIHTNDGGWIVVGTGPSVRGPRANSSGAPDPKDRPRP